jgi:hypothetical protein
MNVLQKLAVKLKYLLINQTFDNLATVSSCGCQIKEFYHSMNPPHFCTDNILPAVMENKV